MNPETSFTYNGITVNYSEAQKAIVLGDQNLITKLKADLISYQNEYNRQEGLVNEAKAHLDNDCNKLSGFGGSNSPRSKCQDTWNLQWDTARAAQATLNGYIAANQTQQASAVKKLNDDIATIQNDIKLQIQTQLANTAAATAAAANQATVTTAPANAAAANAQALQQLQNDAAAAKLKQEQTTKIVGFFFIAVVLITVAVLVIKKV